jgi:hypothetical protein
MSKEIRVKRLVSLQWSRKVWQNRNETLEQFVTIYLDDDGNIEEVDVEDENSIHETDWIVSEDADDEDGFDNGDKYPLDEDENWSEGNEFDANIKDQWKLNDKGLYVSIDADGNEIPDSDQVPADVLKKIKDYNNAQ